MASSTLGEEPLARAVLWTTLGIIVTGSAWLRFRNLAADSVWLDEAWSWMQSKGSLLDLFRLSAQDNHPPLHNLVLFETMNLLGGDGEWVLRLPSALFGTANILVIYWLGSMTGGPLAGLVAAGILGLSGYHVWYSQEARMYPLLALAATMFAAASFHYVAAPTIRRAIWVGLSGLALVYSHPFGVLNWIAIVTAISLIFLSRRGTSTRSVAFWVVSNAIVLLLFLPWAWLLMERARVLSQQGFWVPYPTPQFVIGQMSTLLGGRILGALVFLGCAMAVFGRWFLPSRVPAAPNVTSPDVPRSVLVLLVWATLPIAVSIAASVVSTPIFFHRFIIGSLPPIALLTAIGLSQPIKKLDGIRLCGSYFGCDPFCKLRHQCDTARGLARRWEIAASENSAFRLCRCLSLVCRRSPRVLLSAASPLPVCADVRSGNWR